jgi:hypothetical protein
MMNVEQSLEWELAGEIKVLGRKPAPVPLIHHKSNMTWPGLEPGPPPWEAGRGNRNTWRKPAPVPFCPSQIQHDLTWAWTRPAAVGSRRLTAWAMAKFTCNWMLSINVYGVGGHSVALLCDMRPLICPVLFTYFNVNAASNCDIVVGLY